MAMVLAVACSQPEATSTTVAEPVTSEEVARAFFHAWQTSDRLIMEQLSEPDALAQADSISHLASASWGFDLCEGAAGTIYCSWTSEAGTLAIGVRNIEEPHLVTSIRILDP